MSEKFEIVQSRFLEERKKFQELWAHFSSIDSSAGETELMGLVIAAMQPGVVRWLGVDTERPKPCL